MKTPITEVNPSSIHEIRQFKYARPFVSCRVDPTGQFLFAGAEDNTVQRWKFASGEQTSFAAHESWVGALAFLPKGEAFFTGGYDGQVIRWPVAKAEPKPEQSVQAHDGWVRALAVSPDGLWLATCGNDNLVRVYSTDEFSRRWRFAGHSSHVYNVAFHPNGRYLVSGELTGVVKQWDLDSGRLVRDLDASVLWKYRRGLHIGGVRGMAFNEDGSLLACSGITEVTASNQGFGKPLVILFDWQTGQQKRLLRPATAPPRRGGVWSIVIHPTGYLIGNGLGDEGTLWFWRLKQEESVFTFKLPTQARDMHLHPDARQLVIAHADGTVRIYSVSGERTEN